MYTHNYPLSTVSTPFSVRNILDGYPEQHMHSSAEYAANMSYMNSMYQSMEPSSRVPDPLGMGPNNSSCIYGSSPPPTIGSQQLTYTNLSCSPPTVQQSGGMTLPITTDTSIKPDPDGPMSSDLPSHSQSPPAGIHTGGSGSTTDPACITPKSEESEMMENLDSRK